MLATILRKEIVSHVLSLRFGITFILFLLLICASSYVTSNAYLQDRACQTGMERLAQDHLHDIVKVKRTNDRFWALYNRGVIDATPVPAWSSLIQGLRSSTPVAVRVSDERMVNIGRGALGNPLAGMLPLPDLLYVVSMVLSLLAILFAFDAVSGEKEQGTLALMLSNAVPRSTILLGKWLGGFLALIVPFLVAVAAAVGYAWWRQTLSLDSETFLRLGVLRLTAGIYISIFFTLSLLISARTHRSATSLLVCLLVWVLWILTIPNLSPVLAKILSPAPSAEKITAEKRAVDRETDLLVQRVSIAGGLWYGQKVTEERDRIRQKGAAQKQRWDRFYEDSMRRQTDLAQTMGRLSPAACWTYAAASLTNTGLLSYANLERAEAAQQKKLHDFNEAAWKHRGEKGEYPDFQVADIPRLQVASVSGGAAVQQATDDILILLILNVVFFMGAFVSFIRYDAR